MKNADQPSFPSHHDYKYNTDAVVNNGLTKREYFAGLAMQGLLSRPPQEPIRLSGGGCPSPAYDLIAEAIKKADELLKQLEK